MLNFSGCNDFPDSFAANAPSEVVARPNAFQQMASFSDCINIGARTVFAGLRLAT